MSSQADRFPVPQQIRDIISDFGLENLSNSDSSSDEQVSCSKRQLWCKSPSLKKSVRAIRSQLLGKKALSKRDSKENGCGAGSNSSTGEMSLGPVSLATQEDMFAKSPRKDEDDVDESQKIDFDVFSTLDKALKSSPERRKESKVPTSAKLRQFNSTKVKKEETVNAGECKDELDVGKCQAPSSHQNISGSDNNCSLAINASSRLTSPKLALESPSKPNRKPNGRSGTDFSASDSNQSNVGVASPGKMGRNSISLKLSKSNDNSSRSSVKDDLGPSQSTKNILADSSDSDELDFSALAPTASSTQKIVLPKKSSSDLNECDGKSKVDTPSDTMKDRILPDKGEVQTLRHADSDSSSDSDSDSSKKTPSNSQILASSKDSPVKNVPTEVKSRNSESDSSDSDDNATTKLQRNTQSPHSHAKVPVSPVKSVPKKPSSSESDSSDSNDGGSKKAPIKAQVLATSTVEPGKNALTNVKRSDSESDSSDSDDNGTKQRHVNTQSLQIRDKDSSSPVKSVPKKSSSSESDSSDSDGNYPKKALCKDQVLASSKGSPVKNTPKNVKSRNSQSDRSNSDDNASKKQRGSTQSPQIREKVSFSPVKSVAKKSSSSESDSSESDDDSSKKVLSKAQVVATSEMSPFKNTPTNVKSRISESEPTDADDNATNKQRGNTQSPQIRDKASSPPVKSVSKKSASSESDSSDSDDEASKKELSKATSTVSPGKNPPTNVNSSDSESDSSDSDDNATMKQQSNAQGPHSHVKVSVSPVKSVQKKSSISESGSSDSDDNSPRKAPSKAQVVATSAVSPGKKVKGPVSPVKSLLKKPSSSESDSSDSEDNGPTRQQRNTESPRSHVKVPGSPVKSVPKKSSSSESDSSDSDGDPPKKAMSKAQVLASSKGSPVDSIPKNVKSRNSESYSSDSDDNASMKQQSNAQSPRSHVKVSISPVKSVPKKSSISESDSSDSDDDSPRKATSKAQVVATNAVSPEKKVKVPVSPVKSVLKKPPSSESDSSDSEHNTTSKQQSNAQSPRSLVKVPASPVKSVPKKSVSSESDYSESDDDTTPKQQRNTQSPHSHVKVSASPIKSVPKKSSSSESDSSDSDGDAPKKAMSKAQVLPSSKGSPVKNTPKNVKSKDTDSGSSDSNDDSSKKVMGNKKLVVDNAPIATTLNNSGSESDSSESDDGQSKKSDAPQKPGSAISDSDSSGSQEGKKQMARPEGKIFLKPLKDLKTSIGSKGGLDQESGNSSDSSDYPAPARSLQQSRSVQKLAVTTPNSAVSLKRKASEMDSPDDSKAKVPKLGSPKKARSDLKNIGKSDEDPSVSRKRKADSVSSLDSSDEEPIKKQRKVEGPSHTQPHHPVNSTMQAEDNQPVFPGGDISFIPKIDTLSKTPKSSNQQSILNFLTPKAPPTAAPTVLTNNARRNLNILKSKYLDSGHEEIGQIDSDTECGLTEEDLHREGVKVYILQCPNEVDPEELIGKKIPLNGKESLLHLTRPDGMQLPYEVYCSANDRDASVGLIARSRSQKKFALTSVRIAGRLTLAETVNLPDELPDETESSPPPRVPFPQNLKPRNPFVDRVDFTAQEILDKIKQKNSKKQKEPSTRPSGIDHLGESRKKMEKMEKKEKTHFENPIIKPKTESPTVPQSETEITSKKKKKKKNKEKTGEECIVSHPIMTSNTAQSSSQNCQQQEPPVLSRLSSDELDNSSRKKKKKMKKERTEEEPIKEVINKLKTEYTPAQVTLHENQPPPTLDAVVSKKHKKKHKKLKEETAADDCEVGPSQDNLCESIASSSGTKKKKKKKHKDH